MSIYVISDRSERENQPVDTARLLRALGASRKLKGFEYAVYMVDQVLEDKDRLSLVTKRLYPETGQRFGVKSTSVERCLRTLIHSCWKREDHELLNHIADQQLKEPPTNSEFIDYMVAFLTRQK